MAGAEHEDDRQRRSATGSDSVLGRQPLGVPEQRPSDRHAGLRRAPRQSISPPSASPPPAVPLPGSPPFAFPLSAAANSANASTTSATLA